MPKASRYEHYFQDVQHAFEALHDVLLPRGLYAELSILFVNNVRRPSELRDVVVELLIRKRGSVSPVWRASEGLRVPGRAKLRPLSSVLFFLMTRAAIDVEEKISLPGDDRSQRGARART